MAKLVLMQIAIQQIKGRRRRQEDACLSTAIGAGYLLVLADGLGGHACGDVASQEAIRRFTHYMENAGSVLDLDAANALQFALLSAHRGLQDLQQSLPACKDMATTLVAAWIHERQMHYISVGDSHLLLIRDAAVLHRNRLHGQGNLVSSCLGYNLAEIDSGSAIALQPGDRVLLASDGVESLGQERWAKMACRSGDAEQMVEGLIAAVQQQDASQQDNCSLVALTLPV